MRSHPAIQPCDPIDYPAPKKFVLVLSCVDFRLLDDLVRFLEHDNLTNRYYHVTMAGTSLGLTDRWEQDVANPKDPPAQFSNWRQTFIDHVKAAVLLTEGKISDIYIVQHENCGAFDKYLTKISEGRLKTDEKTVHAEYAEALAIDLLKHFCTCYNPKATKKPHWLIQDQTPRIHTFFMDLRGSVCHLNSWPASGMPPKCEDCFCEETKEDPKDKSQPPKPKKNQTSRKSS